MRKICLRLDSSIYRRQFAVGVKKHAVFVASNILVRVSFVWNPTLAANFASIKIEAARVAPKDLKGLQLRTFVKVKCSLRKDICLSSVIVL